MWIGSLYKNGLTQHICMSGVHSYLHEWCPFICMSGVHSYLHEWCPFISTKLLREALEANLLELTNIPQCQITFNSKVIKFCTWTNFVKGMYFGFPMSISHIRVIWVCYTYESNLFPYQCFFWGGVESVLLFFGMSTFVGYLMSRVYL